MLAQYALFGALALPALAVNAPSNDDVTIFLGSSCATELFSISYSPSMLGTCRSFTEEFGGESVSGSLVYNLTNDNTTYSGAFYLSITNCTGTPAKSIDNLEVGSCSAFSAGGESLSFQLGSSSGGAVAAVITSSFLFVSAVIHKML